VAQSKDKGFDGKAMLEKARALVAKYAATA
jgi:hypothetical protein